MTVNIREWYSWITPLTSLIFSFFRKTETATETAEPMAHLWAEIISATQSARDHLGQPESNAIDLTANYHLFRKRVTAKSDLRAGDNSDAAEKAKSKDGKFTKDATAKVASKQEPFNRIGQLHYELRLA